MSGTCPISQAQKLMHKDGERSKQGHNAQGQGYNWEPGLSGPMLLLYPLCLEMEVLVLLPEVQFSVLLTLFLQMEGSTLSI